MIQALGGWEAFRSSRYVRFDFAVMLEDRPLSFHRHLWDRWTGRYRVEGMKKDGISYLILYSDVNSRQGQAYNNERIAEGAATQSLLEYGYARFINDTYWLLMPWKTFDPGVHRSLEERVTDSLGSFDVVHLSFDSVGLTPGDQYWAYVNRSTGRMERWRFLLQDGETGDYRWTDWVNVSGVWFSTTKVSADGKTRILTNNINLSPTVEERLFTDASLPLP
jgi:hypothetical protein